MKEVQVINTKLRQKTDDTLRVGAYCRVSTDSEDQMNSFIAQVKYYNDFINKNSNMVLVDIYADEGITGTCVNKRNEFLRMLADAKKGKLDRVLVKSVSRFARNALECIENIRILKTYGTTVFFENDNIDTETMNSEMILYVKSAFAQSEALSVSKRVATSYRMRMEKGEFTTYIPPFGYEFIDGKMCIVKEESKIVKFIFESYLNGMGRGRIVEKLNVDNACGYQWSSSTIGYILKNEKYVGDSLVQKCYTPNMLPLKKKKNNGELSQYYISNTHEAIISRDVFEKVQKKLKENKEKKKNYQFNEKSVFAGKIICGDCGWKYKKRKSNNTDFWVCSHNGIAGVKCNTPNIMHSVLETAFVNMYNKLRIYESEIIDKSLSKLVAVKTNLTNMNSEIVEINKEITILSQQNSMYNDLKMNNIIDDISYYEKTTSLKHRIAELKDKRMKLISIDEDEMIVEKIRKLKKELQLFPKALFVFDEFIFDSIIEKVYIFSEGRIAFKLKAGFELGVNL